MALTQLTGSGLMAMASVTQLGMASVTGGGGGGGSSSASTTTSTLGAAGASMISSATPEINSVAQAALNAALGLPEIKKEDGEKEESAGCINPIGVPVKKEDAVASTTTEQNSENTGTTPKEPSNNNNNASATSTADPILKKEIKSEPPQDDAKVIKGTPSLNLLVHNMFDKDEEFEKDWQNDIREDFEEECFKYGKIVKCAVMHLEPGGKIFAAFENLESAKNCALALAGRWFDKRQLRVEFILDEQFPLEFYNEQQQLKQAGQN